MVGNWPMADCYFELCDYYCTSRDILADNHLFQCCAHANMVSEVGW